MANYANSAGFARAFENLSGLLNMFLQNQLNRDNVADDRVYKDKTYEQQLKDSIVTNMMNNALKGNADLYENNLVAGEQKTIPQQTVAGRSFTTVATPQESQQKIDKINISDFGRLRSNDLRYVPKEDIAGIGSNYMVSLDDQTARILNGVYNTNYKAGQRVPYNLLSGLSSLTTNQRRQENAGVITPKEAMSQLNKWIKTFDPSGLKNEEDIIVGMVENPVANGYLQASGQYDDVLTKYNTIIKSRQDSAGNNQQGDGGILGRIFGNKKENKQKNTDDDLREKAIEQLQQQGYKITEDNINKVVAILKKNK